MYCDVCIGVQKCICIGSLVGSFCMLLVVFILILVRQFSCLMLLLVNVQYGVNEGLLWIECMCFFSMVLLFFSCICVVCLILIFRCSGCGRQMCVQGCLLISIIVSGVLIGVWLFCWQGRVLIILLCGVCSCSFCRLMFCICFCVCVVLVVVWFCVMFCVWLLCICFSQVCLVVCMLVLVWLVVVCVWFSLVVVIRCWCVNGCI